MSWPPKEVRAAVWAAAFVQALRSAADAEWVDSDRSRAEYAKAEANRAVELLVLLGENDREAHVLCPMGWQLPGDGTADAESGAGS
jgi:hypothetical protein